MYQFTDKEKNVLKEMAALQFPGSKANISTRTPIHFVLEQCGEYIPSVIDADVDDADSGEFFFSLNHYDSGRGECNLSSNTASGLVLDFLGISENEVSEYNEKAKEKEDVQFVPFERAMHEQKIPGWLEDVYDLEDYFNAYGIELDSVEITRRTDSWYVRDISFTHKGAKALLNALHKENPKDVRLYASTELHGNYPIIMGALYGIGKALLDEETANMSWEELFREGPNSVMANYHELPYQEFIVAKYKLDVPSGLLGNSGPAVATMAVFASGHIEENNGYEYPVCDLRATLECGSFQKECVYPFTCDSVGKSLGSKDGVITLFNYLRFC